VNQLRLAVVGTGHLGRIHARIAAGLDQVELVAVVDPSEESRRQVAAETGAVPLADCRELFGQVDAAVVATPTSIHRQVASELLSGGIHVLVEKPLAPTLADAEEILALAKRQQLVLQVGHVERFNPAYTSARDKLRDPKYIEARRLSGYTFRSTDIGVVLDLMVHDLDLILNLVSAPLERVEAFGISVLGDQEDMVSARLQFATGCVANVTASRVSYFAERVMHVVTPECSARLDFHERRTSLVEPRPELLGRTFEVEKLSPTERNHLRENLFTELLPQRTLPALEVNAIEQEQLDFVGAIQLGMQPQVTGLDGRNAVALAEQILEQVAAHRWDGAHGYRQGAFALPADSNVVFDPHYWAEDDTVILPRKAG
jgi:predicted dehydrogenase